MGNQGWIGRFVQNWLKNTTPWFVGGISQYLAKKIKLCFDNGEGSCW
jgi:hypothetical protein